MSLNNIGGRKPEKVGWSPAAVAALREILDVPDTNPRKPSSIAAAMKNRNSTWNYTGPQVRQRLRLPQYRTSSSMLLGWVAVTQYSPLEVYFKRWDDEVKDKGKEPEDEDQGEDEGDEEDEKEEDAREDSLEEIEETLYRSDADIARQTEIDQFRR